MSRVMRFSSATAVALLCFVACKASEPSASQASSSTATVSPQAHDSALTRDNAALQAQKDSLFGATRSLMAAMASIDSATALAGVKPGKQKGEPIPSYEEGVRQRTMIALQRLRATQARLRAINSRLAAMGGENSAMKAQIDTFRLTVTALQTQLTTQQTRADSLVRELAIAQVRGDSLAGRTRQLGATIDSMTTESHRVFVIAGTKDYLIKHGIIEQVGGTRFPFIVRVGSSVRPVNAHPDTTLFTSFDMMALRTIPVDSTKRYEVVSSQDLNGADRSDAKGRVFRGAIRVTDPQVFWRESPYLILMQQ